MQRAGRDRAPPGTCRGRAIRERVPGATRLLEGVACQDGRRPALLPVLVGVLLAALAVLGSSARAGSDVPPKGPTWYVDLVEAQETALREGKPIFCYFTKTYCPHCVKVEQDLLSSPRLAEVYDEVVWLYDYQTFAKDARDRQAERIAIRFGVTSWPQLFLVDPATLQVLRHTGREVEGFLKAVRETRLPSDRTTDAATRLREAEARAIRLEEKPTKKLARAGVEDADIVVRTRALAYLAKESPKDVLARAVELLAVPSDPFRFQVCEVLQAARDATAAPALEALLADPTDSLNPNVLRIRAAGALSTCGRPESLAVLAPHATSGAYFNGLTRTAISAMLEIAKRHPKTLPEVRATLRQAYPAPPGDADLRAQRACVELAKWIHEQIGGRRPFPDPYDAAARERLMQGD